jgi:bifunctional DNase/RNase
MIEVIVDSIRVSLMSEHRLIMLKEVNGERQLPIWIGPWMAEAIAIRLQNRPYPRPLTHDLLNTIINEMGGEVSHIVVNEMRNDTYYARITINVNGQKLELDSRPSDAIALAIRANATIFVEDEVMRHSITPEADIIEDVDGEELAAFREFVNNLDLDDLPIQ